MNFATTRKSLRDVLGQQDKLLAEMREQRPSFFCSLPFLLYGPAVRLADEDDSPYCELWAEVHWTARAIEYIQAGEYRYISPEFDLDYYDEKKGKHIGAVVLAIGMTNRPFLKGMADIPDPGEGDV